MDTRPRSCVAGALFSLISTGVVLVSTPRPADASGGCIYIAKYGPNASLDCSSTTGTLAHSITTISCDTGTPPTSCNDGAAAANGVPLPYSGCYEPGEITIGPLVFDACGKNHDDPPACKTGGTTSDGRRSAAGLVGDPVDLRTGALSLDPTDVDLGSGLRFARHYSSKTTVQSTMGKSWAHSLDWKLFRTTAQTYSVLIVKEPLRPAVAFATNGTDGYVTSPLNSGSVTVDGSGVVHYTSDTGVEADFDAQNRLIALRPPGEPEIAVSYGTNTTTFTNGSQTLAVSRVPDRPRERGPRVERRRERRGLDVRLQQRQGPHDGDRARSVHAEHERHDHVDLRLYGGCVESHRAHRPHLGRGDDDARHVDVRQRKPRRLGGRAGARAGAPVRLLDARDRRPPHDGLERLPAKRWRCSTATSRSRRASSPRSRIRRARRRRCPAGPASPSRSSRRPRLARRVG